MNPREPGPYDFSPFGPFSRPELARLMREMSPLLRPGPDYIYDAMLPFCHEGVEAGQDSTILVEPLTVFRGLVLAVDRRDAHRFELLEAKAGNDVVTLWEVPKTRGGGLPCDLLPPVPLPGDEEGLVDYLKKSPQAAIRWPTVSPSYRISLSVRNLSPERARFRAILYGVAAR